MGYNIVDLIDKSINISIRKKAIYENILKQEAEFPSIEILSKTLIKQIDKTIKYYEALKAETNGEIFEDINISVYDRMSFLINEFNKKMYQPKINSAKEFLAFSLTWEKDTYSLFIDLQGRFTRTAGDVNTRTYKILSNIIDNKVKLINTLEKISK